MGFDITAEALVDVFTERKVTEVIALGGVEGVAAALDTSLRDGLDPALGLDLRANRYGRNVLPKKDAVGFMELFIEALSDKTLIILIVSAVVSIVLSVYVEKEGSGWIEGSAIIVAVLVVSLVTAGNDYSKEQQFARLNEVIDDQTVKVVRNRKLLTASTYELLVGDVVLLETGDKIPADGLAYDTYGLKVDESAMTGEPDAVKKNAAHPLCLSGTQVMEGQGRMLVCAVGPHSQWGLIKALLGAPDEATPLQSNLETLAENIGYMGLVAAVLTMAVQTVQWVMLVRARGDDEPFEWSECTVFVDFLITAITIVVVAVPEGLPLAVTISLAYSMLKMMKDNNLVRHLEACETMGGATNICSDKTGTLTQNRMTVVAGLFGGEMYDAVAPTMRADVSDAWLSRWARATAVNSTAYIVKSGDAMKRDEYIGSKTECALLLFNETLDTEDYQTLRDDAAVVRHFPFSSLKKRMSVVVAEGGGSDGGKKAAKQKQARVYVQYTKGASEVVLAMCDRVMLRNGSVETLSNVAREEANGAITRMARSGLRTLTIAYREVAEAGEDVDEAQSGLVLLGVAGIKDPVRAEVPAAVRSCKTAGITVRMLTGDNLLTASHIARECGILTDDGLALEGAAFRKLSDAALDKVLPRLQVMARCSPQDKHRLVKRLRTLGEVVAVTGDGTNDAPQLKEADVGFAMGIAGTEVAKDASDIVLLDDNFSSIVKAVLWGRNVYDSIRKFVQFQLTVNVVAVTIAFVGAITTGESPLQPVQLLWVNLIMDTMAALALATEAPTPDMLTRKPYGRYDSLITATMWKNILTQALYQLVVLFYLLYRAERIESLGLPVDRAAWDENTHVVHTTIVFNAFVMCQLFNEINARKINGEANVIGGIFTNWIFLAVMAFTALVQWALVQYGDEFSETEPLNYAQWVLCMKLGAGCVLWGQLVRTAVPASLFNFLARPRARPAQPEEKASLAAARKWKAAAKSISKQQAVIRAFAHKQL